MKLIRFGDPGREEPGVLLENGRMMDASGEFHDYDEGFFASGGLEALSEWVSSGCPGASEIPSHERLGPPVARPSKILCIQLNLQPIYMVDEHPLPWLTPLLNGVEHANFFETRATEYSKGATRGNWNDVWSSFDKRQKAKAVNEDAEGEDGPDMFEAAE